MNRHRLRAVAEHCLYAAAAWMREAVRRDEIGQHRTRGGALPTSELVANQRAARERKHRPQTEGAPRARFTGANLPRVIRYNTDWAPRPWWLAVEKHFAWPPTALAKVLTLRPVDLFPDGTHGHRLVDSARPERRAA